MKKIILALSALAALTFAGCNKIQEPYPTAGEDDFPRILNTDIEETTGGKPSSLGTISRDQNFVFEIIVTPVEYTTVSWYFDGDKLFEGKKIDMPLLAGDYEVKIVATTTKGKETFRNCTLKVLPLESDPAISEAPADRWLQFGTTATVSGSNLANVTKAYLKVPEGSKANEMVELQNVTASETQIGFDVPTLAEGDYKLIVETSEGEQFGVGVFNLRSEKFAAPEKTEVILWTGNNALNWDAENIKVTSDAFASVAVGTEIHISFTKIAAEALAEIYWALRITTPWWGDNVEDNLLPQTDFGDVEDGEYILVYSQHGADLVNERGAMCLVGNGLTITKIAYFN